MRTTRRLTLLTTILVLLFSAVAFAGKTKTSAKTAKLPPETAAVKAAYDKISDLLSKQASAAQVTTAVRDFIDIDELGKRALVDHWSSMSSAQQTKFLELLHKLIEQSYTKGLKANLTYKVNYTGQTTQTNGDVVVKTEIKTQRHGHPFTAHVDYTVTKQGKKWKAVDVANEGQGLIDNYKSEFDKVIDKDGVDALLKKMQKKVDDTAADASDTATN